MAGIDSLKNRILKDDEIIAKQILDEASSKADEIIKHSREKAEAMLKDAGVKAEKESINRQERIIARARLDARNRILSSKQETIDYVLKLAQDRIYNMEIAEYSALLEKMLESSIEAGNEEIIFSERDRKRIDPGLIDSINRKLVQENKKGMLKISSETRNIKSGFILRHGGVEINCSIDSQIRLLRDSLEGELANLLFEKR